MTSYIDIDLSSLKDSEIELRLQELTKKYFTAQRLGKAELLTQINDYIIMHRQELQMRSMKNKTDIDNDLNQLINVD